MSLSSPTKTSWFSDSDRDTGRPEVDREPLVELEGISLRFLSYYDKQYSFKRAAIDMFLRRVTPNPAGEFWALRDVSIKIAKGERVGIFGSNGAGKSTLLRLMARIYTPTSGRMAIRGSVAPLIEMGAGFNFELSGTENIRLNGAMLGYKRKQMDAKAAGIFDFTGLHDFADLPLKYYSSGMYTKLAFAIATEIEPDILLIDESLGAGDGAFKAKARDRILGLLDRSNVVVIVSHELKSLREMCTRGIWMKGGRVAADGPIDEVIDRYIEDYVATTATVSPTSTGQGGPDDETPDQEHPPTVLEDDASDPPTGLPEA
jgi:ABC-type polysaccharide/polyol phosphate transport system ATPase subunit